jgi:hypothetical protein
VKAPQASLDAMLAPLRDARILLAASPDELASIVNGVRRLRLLGRLAVAAERSAVVDSLPRVVADQFRSARVAAAARARAALWELDRVAYALRGQPGIPLVALKGAGYLLTGLPVAEGRSFADVDLLVPEDDLATVESTLRRSGWVPAELTPYDERYYRRWTHELPPLTHVERALEVDVHRGILMPTARLKPSPALLFAASRAVPGSRFRVLAPADRVLHAMAHLFYGSEMDGALRELLDIDDQLRHSAADEPGFWDGFWPRAKALGLGLPAYYGLRYSSQLLGTPVPPGVLEASQDAAPSAPVIRLMDGIVPRALLPRPLDASDASDAWARRAAYLRSHWVKMPPLLLARHLVYKGWVRLARDRGEPGSAFSRSGS